MLRSTSWLLSCLALVAAIGFWAFRPGPAAPRHPTTPPQSSDQEKHYVTPQQLTATAALAATSVPPLKAITHRDQPFTWPRPDDGRLLVLVFIKEGCPCNVELEPFFHRLERAYSDVAHFAGVIDADVPKARHYAEANNTPYPVLADPERQIIKRFHAENGAYVALVTPAGTIATLWPGCSAEMFAQMGRGIARAAGVAARPLNVSGLPDALITGCPFAP